jgi:hypothetical protein
MVPGLQCQVDGGELRGILIEGAETVIYFVVFVLSYSRMMYVGLSREPVNTDAFIHMHDAAFRYFGGRPEECVYDQAKLVVLHEQYRELTLNQHFHAYATAAGFRIYACEGYDPESKGKVEAGVKYVKNNALYGESFRDWNELEQYIRQWLDDTANERIHGTTGESPKVRYERDERQHMGTYLTPAYLTCKAPPGDTRKVDKTGLLSWKSNKYSVPMEWQQARVGVQEESSWLVISDLEGGQELARHELCQGKGKIIKNRDHYRDKREQIADLEIQIHQHVGEQSGKRLCALLKQTNGRIYKDQLVGLRALLKCHTVSPELLAFLCDRSTLATSQIREYLEVYTVHPERFTSTQEKRGKDHDMTGPLSQYADIIQQTMEVNCGHLH